jgi:hypothetical protein
LGSFLSTEIDGQVIQFSQLAHALHGRFFNCDSGLPARSSGTTSSAVVSHHENFTFRTQLETPGFGVRIAPPQRQTRNNFGNLYHVLPAIP